MSLLLAASAVLELSDAAQPPLRSSTPGLAALVLAMLCPGVALMLARPALPAPSTLVLLLCVSLLTAALIEPLPSFSSLSSSLLLCALVALAIPESLLWATLPCRLRDGGGVVDASLGRCCCCGCGLVEADCTLLRLLPDTTGSTCFLMCPFSSTRALAACPFPEVCSPADVSNVET